MHKYDVPAPLIVQRTVEEEVDGHLPGRGAVDGAAQAQHASTPAARTGGRLHISGGRGGSYCKVTAMHASTRAPANALE